MSNLDHAAPQLKSQYRIRLNGGSSDAAYNHVEFNACPRRQAAQQLWSTRMNEFALLIDAEIPRLRRYARALTQRYGSHADGLVQETLLRAISRQDLWQPGTNLRAWLFTLMHNLNVNNIRRSIREGGTVDVHKHCDRLPSISDPSASLLLRDLERALAKLTVERRQAILLVGLEGMSYPRPPKFSTYRSVRCVRVSRAVATSCASSWAWKRINSAARDPNASAKDKRVPPPRPN